MSLFDVHARIFKEKDQAELEQLISNYIDGETVTNHTRFNQNDKLIFVNTYLQVNKLMIILKA